MLRLLANRLALSIPLLFVVSVLVFGLASLVPGDAARTILGEQATPEAVAYLRNQLGLDQPWYERYGSWLAGVLHGDFGTSILSGQDVWTTLNTRLGVTLSLVLTALVVSTVIGVALGLVSAVRGGVLGRVVDVLSLIGLALPNFWIAIVLVSLFAVQFRLFPATGYVPLSASPSEWISSLAMPVAALSLLGIAIIGKQTRDSVLDTLDAEYVRVLRANGVSERRIIFVHVLRNAAIPIVTAMGVVAVGMVGGSVFIESVFVLPGLGSLATQSTLDHDLPVILGLGVYFTVLVIVVNVLVDVAYGFLNPKVRAS
ncbi:ABC transporter permease [Cryptosporangium arvum]|uniref:ABC-type dipeptide/oligopeptide/nickel transport system, permease component n=1 Tax=Cryptosporangium arvum DSM 44712 TaxID=927661 RepID=A0A010ZZP6_9ACTN|nr:ABC transporter permease [Cryptosporangium arvum]EXG82697.1 ABC-type dipeptide/oligopeptide/nickel transport system, permease component [Cryptosporangium arvum DSM 44712]